ncbi:hypothetical protein D3C79_611370 [compost metagenome]
MPEAVVDLLEVIAIEHDGPDVMAASLGVTAFDGVEVVAVEGAGQCIVAGQVIQPAVEAAGSQARQRRHHQAEQGEERRCRLPQQHLQQGQQRDAVDQGERRSGNGVDQLQGTLLPVIPFPRGFPGQRWCRAGLTAGQDLPVLIDQKQGANLGGETAQGLLQGTGLNVDAEQTDDLVTLGDGLGQGDHLSPAGKILIWA